MTRWILVVTLGALASLTVVASSPVDSTCDRLTSEATILLNYITRDETGLQQIIPLMVGFDPFDRNELRRVLCTLSALHDTRGLTDSIHELGLLYYGVRYVYDLNVVFTRIYLERNSDIDMESVSSYLRAKILFYRTQDDLGLLDLDPEGMDFITELTGYSGAADTEGITEVNPETDDVDRCATLQEATERYLLALRDRRGERWDEYVNNILRITGGQLNLNDIESIRGTACALGGVHSMRELYELIYTRYDVARIVGAMYPEYVAGIVSTGTMLYEQLSERDFEFDEQQYVEDVDDDHQFAFTVKMFNFLNALRYSGLLTLQQFGLPWEISPDDIPVPPPPMKWW